MKRFFFPIIVIASMIFSMSGPMQAVQATNSITSITLPDIDQDGIPTSLENSGWYNLIGGPYKTNPNMADSDQDGLTDAQEKLFNTNPLDPQSPGIAVQYSSLFNTLEYYNTTSLAESVKLPVVQGGNQYLIKETLVIRQGTTFKIAALSTANAVLSISGFGLTPLTAARDAARGGWDVNVPANGTVGTYTATITDGAGWSKNMKIKVVSLTDTIQTDTDQDGLSDVQEALFATDLADPHSPGISIPYDNAYKTFEYYSKSDPAYLALQQGGDQYLLNEAFVVRRGTTFKIAALSISTAVLTISGDGLTPLTVSRDTPRAGWNVSVPADGTVGTYTATITDGTWSKSMPVYVIFALPTDMTAAQVNAYVYDDDPANKRDETAVWWRAVDWPYYNGDSETETPCDITIQICSGWQYHTVSGYAQAFWTEQFTKNVLLNYTLPSINGLSTPYAAAAVIADKADQSVRVNFASVKNNFTSATKVFFYPDDPAHPTTPYKSDGGGCETSAGVFTAILRSAGIPAQEFVLDYNKTPGHGEGGNFAQFEYDTAVTMWVKAPGDASNQWYADRSFNEAESEYQTTPVWSSGTAGIRLLADVGVYNPGDPAKQFKKFQDYYSDVIQMANEGWSFQNGSLGGGTVNLEWTGTDVPQAAEFVPENRDFKWNSKYPLQIQQSPDVTVLNCQVWKGDAWAPSEWYALSDPLYVSLPTGRTALQTYYLPTGVGAVPGDIENWPYNPQPTSCSASTSADACAAFKLTQTTNCAALPGQTLTSLQALQSQSQQILPAASVPNAALQLGSVRSDKGVDLNGDGRFDQLVVTFDLTSDQAGEYQLGGWLLVGNKQVRADHTIVQLSAGSQSVQVTFDGQQIGDNKVNGPYQVAALWAAPASQAVSELALPEEMAAFQAYSYESAAYEANAFKVLAASVAGNYSYSGKDTNANGFIDTVTISVPLNVAVAGKFSVDGDLFDGEGNFVGHATWTGSGPAAALNYTVTGTTPPYSLERLNLVDAQGWELNSFYASVYKIEDLAGEVDLGNIAPVRSSAAAAPQTISPSITFGVTPVDLNGNGRYDNLTISATVNVTVQGGSYWMEGLLVDDRNLPVAWSVSDPQPLAVGSNQTIQMSFDTKMLFDTLPLTGSQKFTLVAVKIFSGVPGTTVLEVDIPVPGFNTPAYTRAQFEPSSLYSPYPDDIPAGTALLTTVGSSQWNPTTTTWHSWTSAWAAVGSATKNGLLSLPLIDLTNYASPWLWFNTSYALLPGQSVVLEASKDGVSWTTLKTFTGSTTYWSSELIDLSAYGKTAGVMIRFNAKSYDGLAWSVADIYVKAGPAIKSASFTYTSPVKTGNTTIFTADYVSINKTLPLIYKWNICGSLHETRTPTISYLFREVGNCQVNFTIDNGYDAISAVGQTIPVSLGTHHTYLPVLSR